MSDKPWAGRFSEKTDSLVEAFSASIHYDKRLYPYDIEGSIAHCKMLAKAKIITEDESAALIQGLINVKRELDHNTFTFSDSLEDIHMHIEARLVQDVGSVAQKLHTARSRNDQVALDVRMYLKAATEIIIDHLFELRSAIVALSRKHLGVVLPGYTHMQRAQPVVLSHHLMAYYEMFTRDVQRFEEGYKRTNVMPLGAAALAGTTYPIDRAYTAELLGFPEISANSMDAVSDRDFILEFNAAAGICMVHLSRMSEELIYWSSSEFDFIEMPDAFTTGSSIMPQKKNPDVSELVRGKTGRVFGNLMALLTLMKSLPMAYNRDMQEDKEPLFDTVDTLTACLSVYAKMIPHIVVKQDTMRNAASTGYLNATDMADYLVSKGIPFRKAHECVGKAVAFGLSEGRELHELTLEELKLFSTRVEADIFERLTLEQMVHRRTSAGGTAPDNVQKAIAEAQHRLDKEKH
ncbi:MAG: argininosuccinate lyase [Desulfobacteraceae bacterium]|nr:argininosuccinate lyase [Desulfobacteraceae bacterium]